VPTLAQWLGQQEKSHPSAIDLTLSRVREVARHLRLLAPPYRVVTVGGTNGKGSTVAFIDATFRLAGKRCGRFTSPHLRRYNERICVDGVEASDAELIQSFERIDAVRGSTTLTFFEYNALAALDHFQRMNVDVAVLEVGLGGRLDATNIIDADVAVVCSIGLDHMDWLGGTVHEIAREKAGIFRSGRPAVLGSSEMPMSLFDTIREVGALPTIFGRDFQARESNESWDFEFGSLSLRDLPMPAMRGTLQLRNAATAFVAVSLAGIDVQISTDIAEAVMQQTRIDGRFQIIHGDIEWILDVAHNVPAAQALRANLQTLPMRHTIAVCGILADKDIAGITAEIRDEIDMWVLVGLSGPRAVNTQEIAARIPGVVVAAHADDVEAGCRAALALARPGDRVLVFGSFLTVGPALEFLRV
jgi:dihydrofolate synthase/folylpolyglutamate synthase